MSEHFNVVSRCLVAPDCEIETDDRRYPEYAGRLWLGSTWLTVAEARVFRDWLDQIIPKQDSGHE